VRSALLAHAGRKGGRKILFDPRQTLHAPHLLDVEVAGVIRRYSANGEIDHERGRAALTDLADLPLPLPNRSTLCCSRATGVSPRRPAIMRGSSWSESDAIPAYPLSAS
jgi:predicted nucleic acid-binding protein